MFGFCTCANIKQVHVSSYKETDLHVQFTDNYPDWVSVPVLVLMLGDYEKIE